jgi:hypothetical protein
MLPRNRPGKAQDFIVLAAATIGIIGSVLRSTEKV